MRITKVLDTLFDRFAVGLFDLLGWIGGKLDARMAAKAARTPEERTQHVPGRVRW